MKISEVAAAAGTTPRAVRHYHRLGLLPEPSRRQNGYRAYGIAELARLMRIRWLAEHGLPLGSVAAVLAEEAGTSDTDDLRADLIALHDDISRSIAELTRKRDRLGRMLATTATGRPPTALPENVAAALDRAREQADDLERAALDQERDLLEVLAVSGRAPDEMFAWFAQALTDSSTRESRRRILREWDRLSGRPVAVCGERIEAVARDMAVLLRSTGIDAVLAAAGSVPDTGTGRLAVDTLLPDPAQRAVILRTLELLASGAEGDRP
ncbi:MerR family transcriptional regulator [Nocardia sp. X0981]